MKTDTRSFDKRTIEIIPPEPKSCVDAETALCGCCRKPFAREPEDYGICRQCLEC